MTSQPAQHGSLGWLLRRFVIHVAVGFQLEQKIRCINQKQDNSAAAAKIYNTLVGGASHMECGGHDQATYREDEKTTGGLSNSSVEFLLDTVVATSDERRAENEEQFAEDSSNE